MIVTAVEAKRILQGKSEAVTRGYLGGCPFKQGEEVALNTMADGALMEIAIVTVLSVRPANLADRTSGPMARDLAISEGFTDERHWRSHWDREFGVGASASEMYRIRFRVDQVDEECRRGVDALGSGQ